MNHFTSIKDLLNLLSRGKSLLSEMFEKRKLLNYKVDHAMDVLGDQEGVLQLLIDKEVIRQNGSYLELDEQFLQFFEQVLEVNEEINLAAVDENIRIVKDEYMIYYLQSNNDTDRHKYLNAVKRELKKIGRMTQRNLIDLGRNIDNAFKTEPNYRIKLTKLENHKLKLVAIQSLIDQSEQLVNEDELTFFKTAQDDELKRILVDLRLALTDARQNLIEIRKQIIDYINQVKHHSTFMAHLRQLKYLKDQYELKAKTNILEVLQKEEALVFEKKPSYRLKLSTNQLRGDEYFDLIKKVYQQKAKKRAFKSRVAPALSKSERTPVTEREISIDLNAVKNAFLATGNNLFAFVMEYEFPREVPFRDRVTIFCQLIAIYDGQFEIRGDYQKQGSVEYVMVFPK